MITEQDETRPPQFVSLHSADGRMINRRISVPEKFLLMTNVFEPQLNGYYCGPASAVIVINSIHLKKYSTRKMINPSLYLRAVNEKTGLNQETFFNEKTELVKSHSIICEKGHPNNGIQIRELGKMMEVWDTKPKLTIVDQTIKDSVVKNELIAALQSHNVYVIANFCGVVLGQGACGHISPLVAYDAETDSVLLLDVNPGQRPWTWVKLSSIIEAMKTFDVVENRGYLIITDIPS